jgi:hypothetical protein
VDKSKCIKFLIKLLQAADISTTGSAQQALPKLRNLLITVSITAEIAQNAKEKETRSNICETTGKSRMMFI